MARPTGKPTIRDVAADCGLSIATVSAVVNNAGWVPDHTRVRVQRSIINLGYRPNRLARSLKTSLSDTVGVIVSDVTNPYFTDIVRSLGHALRENERNLLLSESEHEFDLGEWNFRMLVEKQVDAIVIVGDSVHEDVLESFLPTLDIPIVAIGRDYKLDRVSQILVDSEQGAYDVTRHLLEEGYEQIAMISGPFEGSGSRSYGPLRRRLGYERALTEAGQAVRPELIVEGNYRISGGRSATEVLLSLDHPPDAIFASNDLMAIGAMDAIFNHRLSVPEDVGLVGSDDIPMAEFARVPLTTLASPRATSGKTAARLVLEGIGNGKGEIASRHVLPCELVVRKSSRRSVKILDP
jgi:LacI family transcriptional regulator